MAKQAQPTY